jgi:hypothetical protein
MSSVLPRVSGGSIDDLAGNEARVARWSRAYPQIGVFFYDLNTLGGGAVVSMVSSHRRLWMGGVVVDNPYFNDPSGG